ncbi:MAG: SPOR domain-containing protein [Candidatus Omnitrophica bacterium]|nr:SPOR domain-containing protein [Candidatus Omnitrophota bacterium]
MEKTDNLQLELFSQGDSPAGPKEHRPGREFFTRIRNYEKIILIIISVATTGIIFYSFGVEKGKILAGAKDTLPISQTTVIAVPAGPSRFTPEIKEGVKEPPPAAQEGYIIQLASYKNRSSAEKEAGLLKKKGFSPLVLNKGDYIVLYIGNLPTRKTAQDSLPELKKRYKDCYIRRL